MDASLITAAKSISSDPEAQRDDAIEVRNFAILGPSGQIPVRLYQPRSTTLLPIVMYFHGGGFVSGTLDDADQTAQFIAAQCPALVLCVDYALAPARPFPAHLKMRTPQRCGWCAMPHVTAQTRAVSQSQATMPAAIWLRA